MTLEELDRIDMAVEMEDGELRLIIMDAGLTEDEDEKFDLFIAKLKTYILYAMSDEFKQDNPTRSINDVTIHVICRVPPTQKMQSLTQVGPSTQPDIKIPVTFEVFNPDE